MSRMQPHFTSLLVVVTLIVSSGCVMSERYEAEKARALNFQRLLAQEEKRTGELDADLKRARRENAELEARNREVSAQLQAVREQLGRVQEETNALREAMALREQQERQPSRSRRSERQAPAASRGAPSPSAPPGVGAPVERPADLQAENGEPIYHQVQPGETLFRLARQYGVKVDRLRQWNALEDDLIEVGQRLIVGYR